MEAYEELQIDRLKALFAARCLTVRGKEKALKAGFLSKLDLEETLNGIREMELVYARYGAIPLQTGEDLRPLLNLASKGAGLDEHQLKQIAEEGKAAAAYKQFAAGVEDAPILTRIASYIPSFPSLVEEIDRCIDSSFYVVDKASPELRSVRSSIKSTTRAIQDKLSSLVNDYRDYLSAPTLTMRDGHYVLPVLNAYKSKVPGNSLGYSGSGASIFIEPERLVSLNAKLSGLLEEEKDEVAKVLRRLSALVGSQAEDIELTNDTLSDEDLRLAKAKWMSENEGHVGQISSNLYIPDSWHPLLGKEKAIPNTFSLSKKRRLLVISGPNAGGKTVALKTVGIIAILFKMGFPLPCGQGAEIPYFSSIEADIGDHQSLDDNLSTFSGHIHSIATCLKNIDSHSLLLLDEVGTGTSPHEGEAIAVALLEKVLSIGCFALVSSHFELVKEFALSEEGASNACMEFDEATLEPTYHLHVGSPGESFALVLSERFGLDHDVVSRAKQIAKDGEEVSVAASIKKLSSLIKENEDLRASLKEKQRQIEDERAELSKKEASFEKEKKQFAESLEAKTEAVLAKAKSQAEEAIKSLSQPGVKLHEAVKAKAQLDELMKEDDGALSPRSAEPLKEGDYVESLDYPLQGTITKLSGKKAVVSSSKGMSFTLAIDSLKRVAAPESAKPSLKGAVLDGLAKDKSLSLECNLIGLRYEEAKQELDRYLDSCRVKGFKRVRIIHGLGSGALKRMTAEYCKTHSFIDRFETAGEGEGGAGATVVYLK